ncbi:MAG: hypothetical protein H0W76_13090 [Pyrinomonadaceae bacterium]|nr:hypothetical protein [Pyrinomonadaceae bacterium]
MTKQADEYPTISVRRQRLRMDVVGKSRSVLVLPRVLEASAEFWLISSQNSSIG